MSRAIQRQPDRGLTQAGAERTRNESYFQPPVDIFELPGELTLVADMPGAQKESIDIQFENGSLSIYGQVRSRQPESTRYLWNEYSIGDYYRTFHVSEAIDSEQITAEYSDGQLTLHLPKVQAAQPRKIEVQTK